MMLYYETRSIPYGTGPLRFHHVSRMNKKEYLKKRFRKDPLIKRVSKPEVDALIKP